MIKSLLSQLARFNFDPTGFLFISAFLVMNYVFGSCCRGQSRKGLKNFDPLLNVGSLRFSPPRAWKVIKDNDVCACIRPPEVGGEWCTHVNVYFFYYEETMGGSRPNPLSLKRSF